MRIRRNAPVLHILLLSKPVTRLVTRSNWPSARICLPIRFVGCGSNRSVRSCLWQVSLKAEFSQRPSEERDEFFTFPGQLHVLRVIHRRSTQKPLLARVER